MRFKLPNQGQVLPNYDIDLENVDVEWCPLSGPWPNNTSDKVSENSSRGCWDTVICKSGHHRRKSDSHQAFGNKWIEFWKIKIQYLLLVISLTIAAYAVTFLTCTLKCFRTDVRKTKRDPFWYHIKLFPKVSKSAADNFVNIFYVK